MNECDEGWQKMIEDLLHAQIKEVLLKISQNM
jgi:hypothetical protein